MKGKSSSKEIPNLDSVPNKLGNDYEYLIFRLKKIRKFITLIENNCLFR